MKTCPICAKTYDDDASFCMNDGSPLEAAVATDPMVGFVVDNRYRILNKIGEGGYGAVYVARHLNIPRDVALKVMWDGTATPEAQVRRFEYEVRSIVSIGHPNIVHVYDFGHDSQIGPWVAMERLEGEDLGKRIKDGPLLGVFEIWAVMKGVCRALDAAHQEGVIHRDVKPSNIFLVDDPAELHGFAVKLLDFGIATVSARAPEGTTGPDMAKTADNRIIGTPAIMSPEQVEGRQLDGRVDIYALGVVLFNMLTRRNLYSARNAQELLLKHVVETPKAPSTTVEGDWIPPALDGLVASLLAKKPEDRPATGADVIRRLEKVRAAVDSAWARQHLGQPTGQQRQPSGLQRRPSVVKESSPAAERSGPPTVLAVDDEPAILDLLRLVLERAGYDCRTARGGQDALDQLDAALNVDALVVDLMMPDIDGVQCIEAARELGYDGPVVVCTTLSSMGIKSRLEHLEGVRFLDKTTELHRLQAILDELLGPP